MNKEKFNTFVKIQKTGITNMRDIDFIVKLSKKHAIYTELEEKDCFDIIKNYKKFTEKYNINKTK